MSDNATMIAELIQQRDIEDEQRKKQRKAEIDAERELRYLANLQRKLWRLADSINRLKQIVALDEHYSESGSYEQPAEWWRWHLIEDRHRLGEMYRMAWKLAFERQGQIREDFLSLIPEFWQEKLNNVA